MSELAVSRTLACTRCGEDVDVVELPVRHLDPARFVCGACLLEPERARQLSLVQADTRGEVRSYDPSQSEIAF